jgi:hypothetical protein
VSPTHWTLCLFLFGWLNSAATIIPGFYSCFYDKNGKPFSTYILESIQEQIEIAFTKHEINEAIIAIESDFPSFIFTYRHGYTCIITSGCLKVIVTLCNLIYCQQLLSLVISNELLTLAIIFPINMENNKAETAFCSASYQKQLKSRNSIVIT